MARNFISSSKAYSGCGMADTFDDDFASFMV
jgi:hypothetical protein